MQFRYDFGEKLDLSKFKKQASHYIGTMRQLTFLFFVRDFKISIDIATPDDCNGHTVNIFILEIIRDNDGELIDSKTINLAIDLRFNEIINAKNGFLINSQRAYFDSNNIKDTVDKICYVINFVHKVNNLLVFL